jgi:hypothetical protein
MSNSQQPLSTLVESLPHDGLTVRLLHGLDYLVPGSWENETNFATLIGKVVGETDESVIQAVGERAIALYADPELGYQRAVWIYETVDTVDRVAGGATLLGEVASRFDLSFLGNLVPKADTAQAIDAAVKLGAELAAFCQINGLPGDSVGDFASSLTSAAKEDLIRIAAWLAFDCVLPLGPDAIGKVTDRLSQASEAQLGESSLFAKIQDYLPGGIAQKKELLLQTLASSTGFFTSFIQDRGLSSSGILGKVSEYVQLSDDKLDVAAGMIDVSTNYFEHTGIQTVARRVITRAYSELLARERTRSWRRQSLPAHGPRPSGSTAPVVLRRARVSAAGRRRGSVGARACSGWWARGASSVTTSCIHSITRTRASSRRCTRPPTNLGCPHHVLATASSSWCSTGSGSAPSCLQSRPVRSVPSPGSSASTPASRRCRGRGIT